MSSLSFRNKFLTLTLKKYAKTDIKVFQTCLTVVDFLIFLEIFCAVLQIFKLEDLQNTVFEVHDIPTLVTAQNTAILHNFLVWKFCGNTQSSQ